MAEQELEMEEGGSKKKLIIIVAAVVVLLAGAGAAYFMLGSADEPMPAEQAEMTAAAEDTAGADSNTRVGTALYVAMPRPFLFNVPGSDRDRLVQIKVQLMVRGSDNEDIARQHVPMIEGTLLKVFSTANADDLVTEAGKIVLKDQSTREVQMVLKDITGNQVVERVLFTGFVMQ